MLDLPQIRILDFGTKLFHRSTGVGPLLPCWILLLGANVTIIQMLSIFLHSSMFASSLMREIILRLTSLLIFVGLVTLPCIAPSMAPLLIFNMCSMNFTHGSKNSSVKLLVEVGSRGLGSAIEFHFFLIVHGHNESRRKSVLHRRPHFSDDWRSRLQSAFRMTNVPKI